MADYPYVNAEPAYASPAVCGFGSLGGYEEAGDNGRFEVRAGNVVLHDSFEAHLNRFLEAGALVLNLPLPPHQRFRPGLAKLKDPDLIVRIAETDELEAVSAILLAIRGSDEPFQGLA